MTETANNTINQSNELKSLNAKRGGVKAQVTIIKKTIAPLIQRVTLSPSESHQIAAYLQRLYECQAKFEEFQDAIEVLVKEEDLEKTYEYRATFDVDITILISDCKAKLGETVEPTHTQTAQQIHTRRQSTSDAHNSNSNIKLPTIKLPSFDGSARHWLEFYDVFKSLIHESTNLSETEKFYYLRTALTGEAAVVIQSIGTTAENYAVAWETLCDRFNKSNLIIDAHVKSLFELSPIVKESATALRTLLDTVTKHLRCLQTLKEPTEHWDTLIIHLTSSKLDHNSRREWEIKRKTYIKPTFREMSHFLQERWEILETLQGEKGERQNPTRYKQFSVAHHATINQQCPFCKQNDHYAQACSQFLKLNTDAKREEVRRLNLCFNCLRSNHRTFNCKSNLSCRYCHRKHNSLLHLSYANANANNRESSSSTNVARSTSSEQSTSSSANVEKQNSSETICNHASQIEADVLLSTAIANIADVDQNLHTCRILLDCASQSSYITRQLAEKLKCTQIPINMSISGINQATTSANTCIKTSIFSRSTDYQATTTFIVIENITKKLPIKSFNAIQLSIPNNVILADPEYNRRGTIDVLLGAELFWHCLSQQQVRLGKQLPVLQETKFGWILGGGLSHFGGEAKQVHTHLATLDSLVQKFWEIENVDNNLKAWSEEQQCAEQHFKQTVTRNLEGRFVVKIPLRDNIHLGNSRGIAEKRFQFLEKRLRRDDDLKQMYADFMKEYINLNHMKQIIENGTQNKPVYYMPHHPVVREHSLTTKCRVVYDASCKTDSGHSLNDMQLVGPTVQSDLFSILLRFRMRKYILSGDISKMYRMILIDDSQKALQRILWRNNENEELKCYELQTLTYGTASAPFLATRCIKELAIEHRESHELASNAIENDMYVDDLLTGHNDIQTLKSMKQTISQILRSGGFELRKFASNASEILDEDNLTQESERDPFITIASEDNKTLGIRWHSGKDILRYDAMAIDANKCINWTKRTILAEVAKLFDPLGIISPVIIIGKLIIQKLWQSQTNWDDKVSSTILNDWLKFVDNLNLLNQLSIPRLAFDVSAETIELHGFADASERAYGACLYIRTVSKDKVAESNLLTAKSRVAPLKTLTLPRLELCAAVLLAQLLQKTKEALKNIKFDNISLWSDSTITLSWISKPCTHWKTFVAHRVAKIQNLSNADQWRHVKSADNPADLVSRGMHLNDLIHSSLWKYGPTWLRMTETNWPTEQIIIEESIPETKSAINLLITKENQEKFDIFTKYSRYYKLIRVTAHVLRFYNNLKRSIQHRATGFLRMTELNEAKHKLLLKCQLDTFQDEINKLKKGKEMGKQSRINQFSPFLDKTGLLRVGGRLKNSQIDYVSKHQILLDSKHPFTLLLTREIHESTLHSGPQALLYSMRIEYWPTSGRNLVRKVVKNCMQCFRAKPSPIQPIMGNLPAMRVTPAPPFLNCGTDYAGPILIKDRKGRGCKITKAYICLFVCMATKAYHIEAVSDLTTNNFIAAFKRFIARRGKPAQICSDNGTNYVGANKEIKKLYDFLNLKATNEAINNYLTLQGVTWHFIPPRAPNFGGLWEKGMHAIKSHFSRVIGNTTLLYEELATVLAQIESILNSRPLTPLNSDPNDHTPLTPGHFLIGRPLTALPEDDYTQVPENRLTRFQLISQLTQHFWTRWHKEYLNSLQPRTKWASSTSHIKVDDLVIVKEDNVAVMQWKLARVKAIFTGSDNIARVAIVELPDKTVLKRAVNKLCVLPASREF